MNKMTRVVRARYATLFPQLSVSASLASVGLDLRAAEDVAVLEHLVGRDLDTLLPQLLRPEAFIEIHLARFPGLNTTGEAEIRRELERIAAQEPGGTAYADGRYLKIANSAGGDDYGNTMLSLIANAIVEINSDIYARFRQGDEFVFLHDSINDLLERIEVALAQLATNEVVPGLPVGIDFGYARHAEVATTYLRLLEKGWVPPKARTGSQVFLDIALKIAKVRSDVQKIYNRAWLLYSLYEELADSNMSQYRELENQLTRGNRFITPSDEWLEVGEDQLPDYIRLKVLAFLGEVDEGDLFAQVCTQVAESVYMDQIST